MGNEASVLMVALGAWVVFALACLVDSLRHWFNEQGEWFHSHLEAAAARRTAQNRKDAWEASKRISR